MITDEERFARAGPEWARLAIKSSRGLCLRMKRKYGKRFAYRREWLQTAWNLRRLLRQQ
jgi:hypothetical protein